MSYENKTIFTSGSLTFTNRSVRHVTLTSQQITNAALGTYDILSAGHAMGNFVPVEAYFHYVAAAGTSVTSTAFNMGFSGNFNQYIASGTLTYNANSTNKSNVQQTLSTIAQGTGLTPIPNGSPLRVTITRVGTNTLTGSFIVHGYFMDY